MGLVKRQKVIQHNFQVSQQQAYVQEQLLFELQNIEISGLKTLLDICPGLPTLFPLGLVPQDCVAKCARNTECFCICS